MGHTDLLLPLITSNAVVLRPREVQVVVTALNDASYGLTVG
jgi:hypothetical protein